jgi:hypothetical protein
VLRDFDTAVNFGRQITVRTGQTGDEGWFAPMSLNGTSNVSSDGRGGTKTATVTVTITN